MQQARRRARRGAHGRLVLLLLLLAPPVGAEVLRVGPGEALARPSEAAARAAPGDTVLIRAGRYSDCAVWHTPRITIAAEGGPRGRLEKSDPHGGTGTRECAGTSVGGGRVDMP